MAIDLHNKIAAAISDNLQSRGGADPDDIADVVLQTLDMHAEHGRLRVTRYVTSWYIDDDNA